jgi:hypothetical protein
MTLIAFATHRDRAEIITDTQTYTHNGTRMGHHSKVLTLPHLEAAMMAQGSTGFEARWHVQALYLARQAVDFDDLVREAPGQLRYVWTELAGEMAEENATHGRSAEVTNSVVFLVGYSATERSFVAYGYASDFDFESMRLDGVYAMPSPLDRRPGDVELHRIRKHLRTYAEWLGDDVAKADMATDRLGSLPPGPVPRKPADWVDLAKKIRRDRAMARIESGLKNHVGGDVIHTTVRVGSSTNRRIHTFADSGAEFAQMMAGTLHPISQAGPCECGSGKRYVDCCLRDMADEPCPCRSEKTFADCCSVNADVTALARS